MEKFKDLSEEERQKIKDKVMRKYETFSEASKRKLNELCGDDMDIVAEAMISIEISYRHVLDIMAKKFGDPEVAMFKTIQFRQVYDSLYVTQE